jgi:LysR family transcriptional regulator, glycine cleavage system transcriptional activator
MAKFRLPPLSALRPFEAAARHQSIKHASEELHVTPAAVGRQIQNLERYLARDLFERHHRRIALTDAGKILLHALTRGFSEIQLALDQLSETPSPEKLVISTDADFAGLWLVPRLADFQATVPHTMIEIQTEKTAAASHDRRISCAIHYAEVDRGVGEMLFRSKLFPVCAGRDWIPLKSPDDLRHHVLLHDRSIAEWEEFLRSSPATSNINVRSGIVFSDNVLCLEAAARGQGVAIGDNFLAANHLSEGRLMKPFASVMLSRNAYYLLISEDAASCPAVMAFRAWLLRSIERLHADE